MNNKALVVIDIQNDITKHYRDIIDNINAAIEWAVAERLRLEKNGNACTSMHIVYIKHNNTTACTRTFKPGSKGEELVTELKVVSDNIFVKTKSNALTSDAFSAFITANDINEFYVAGADATACVKSTCFNMAKAGFTVHVLSDCITSYDLKITKVKAVMSRHLLSTNEASAEYPIVAPNGGSCCSVAEQYIKHSVLVALHRLWHQRHSRRVAGSEAEVRYQNRSIAR